jgi:hypothetical protein
VTNVFPGFLDAIYYSGHESEVRERKGIEGDE